MSSCGQSEALMPPKPKFDKSKNCIKCKANGGNIVVRHAVYCKECFFPTVAHKFRRALELRVNASRKSELKAPGSLFIGFSGGLGSTVLLDLVYKNYFAAVRTSCKSGGTAHPRRGSIWNRAIICYVEICSAFPNMRDRSAEVRRVVEAYEPFKFVSLKIEDAFDWAWWESIGGVPANSILVHDLGVDMRSQDLLLTSSSSSSDPSHPSTALRSYLASLPTNTSIVSTVRTLTRLLLLHAARFHDASHLLLGTCLTTLSIDLISGVAQGQGFALREQAEEQWAGPGRDSAAPESGHLPELKVCRPLKDIGLKECAAYAWWTGLTVVGKSQPPGTKQEIASLTKDFVIALERGYPSTVSTIARTCGKFASKPGSDGMCLLCQRPAQSGAQAWKARISIRAFDEGPPAPAPAPAPSPSPSLAPHLCYACHTTLTSRGSRSGAAAALGEPASAAAADVKMPVWVGARLGGAVPGAEVWTGKKLDERVMEERVGEYLLDSAGESAST